MGQVVEVEQATLIVAANVADIQGGYGGILYFVLIARGSAKFRQEITGLCAHVCPVVLIVIVRHEIAESRSRDGLRILLRTAGERVGGEETLLRIEAVLAVVGFATTDFVIPMRAGGEVPAGVRVECMECVALVATRRLEDYFARNSRFAGVVAQRETKPV